MDTALPQKIPFILDRNNYLAKANCIENQVCTSCDTVVFDSNVYHCYKHDYSPAFIFIMMINL